MSFLDSCDLKDAESEGVGEGERRDERDEDDGSRGGTGEMCERGEVDEGDGTVMVLDLVGDVVWSMVLWVGKMKRV